MIFLLFVFCGLTKGFPVFSLVENDGSIKVYDSVIFILSILGIIEWIVFSVINLCTFYNVYKNPDSSTDKWRVIFISIFYMTLRSIFIPFYLTGLIGSDTNTQTLIFRTGTIILAVWWNFTLLIPVATSWYSRMRYGFGNNPLGETELPYNFIVILPVYNETLQLLIEGVDSILNQTFNPKNVEIHVTFDSDDLSNLYIKFIDYFGINLDDVSTYSSNHSGRSINSRTSLDSDEISIYESCRSVLDYEESIFIKKGEVVIFIHRFPHGGKRLTQSKNWDFIVKQRENESIDKFRTLLILTDSDNFMYNNAFQNLSKNFEKHTEKLALSGYMTCMSSKNKSNPLVLLQDTEYISGEMNRGFELLCGTVNCLPGGFTAVRYSSFESVSDRYFMDLSDLSITDYHRNYLGEDRYLTHIMHQEFPKHSMGFCPSARCKTDAPPTISGLIKQRRRWYLGAISNEAYMFTDKIISNKYPVLVLYKILGMAWWRSFFFTQFILLIFLIHDIDFSSWKGVQLQVLSVGIPYIISWLFVIYTGIVLGRYKVIWMYPLSMIPQLFLSFFTDIYTVCTLFKRSWGGIRTAG